MATQSNRSGDIGAHSNQVGTPVEAWLRLYEANRPVTRDIDYLVKMTNQAYDALKNHIEGNGLGLDNPEAEAKA